MIKIFCVYDSKGKHYGKTPFFADNSADAIRSFESVVNDKSTMIGQHPEDFTLFECGEWDLLRGIAIMLDTKVSLGLGNEFIKA